MKIEEGNGRDKTDSFGNINYVAFYFYEGGLMGFIKLHDGNMFLSPQRFYKAFLTSKILLIVY